MEPADGMRTDRALRNREPAVSISSDWFSLLHCQAKHRRTHRHMYGGADPQRMMGGGGAGGQKRQKRKRLQVEWTKNIS